VTESMTKVVAVVVVVDGGDGDDLVDHSSEMVILIDTYSMMAVVRFDWAYHSFEVVLIDSYLAVVVLSMN